MENEKRWKSFVYEVKPKRDQLTQNIKIQTKTRTDCLANDFANQLLANHGGEVSVYAQKSLIEKVCQELAGITVSPETVSNSDSSKKENYTDGACSSDRTLDRNYPNVEPLNSGNGGNENYMDGSSRSDEAGDLSLPSSGTKHTKDDIEINRPRVRDKPKRSMKSDIDKPCSKWTISDIAKYFDFDKRVRKISIDFDIPGLLEDVLQKDIEARINVLHGITKAGSNSTDSVVSRLNAITSNETGTRLVIDAFLFPVCLKLNLTIKLEININCSYLPNCRFDYCIYAGNKIIGCVEAKSPSTLNKNAIAQAIVQLNVLQIQRITDKEETSSDINLPIFCIITDGFRFIFIQIIGKYLHFEINADKDRLHINEITNADEIRPVVYNIARLISSCKSNNLDIRL